MHIRNLFSCFVLSCLAIPCLHAKPFSLNALIEAEEKQKSPATTSTRSTPRLVTETSERFSFNKIFKPKLVKPKKFKRKTGVFAKSLHFKTYSKEEEKYKTETTTWPTVPEGKDLAETKRFPINEVYKTIPQKSKRLKEPGIFFSKGKKISSLQHRKSFQIKGPLKPKKTKSIEKRGDRNQSTKREISEDEKLFRKYLPLLRTLDMLFNNILDKRSGESHEDTKINFRRNRPPGNATCSCHHNGPEPEVAESATTKATVITTTASNEVTTTESPGTKASSSGADIASAGDVSSIGQDSDIPSLPAGNTASTRRDDNGVSAGSRPTLHSSAEGNISGDHRNSEYDTPSGENSASAKSYEKDTNSSSRDNANSAQFGGGGRGDGTEFNHPVYRRGLDNTDYSTKSEKSFRNTGRNFVKPKGKDQFEDRGDETESSEFIPKFLRGDGRYVSENSVNYNSEPVQPEESNEEGGKSVELDVSGHQRFAFGNGPSSSEDQKTNEANTAALISIDDLNSNPFKLLKNDTKNKAPYVTIFDGYSVARDKNGANKLAEQSIRVHT